MSRGEAPMKKSQLLKKLGNNRAIAELLGISVQAVQKWRADRPIPRQREDELRRIRPELFA